MELNQLISCLESLSEVDFNNAETRSLNEAVLLAFGWRQDGKDIIDPLGRVRLQALPVLASIDAALTLVPDEVKGIHLWEGAYGFECTLLDHDGPIAGAQFCQTRAIALVIAALRAKGAQS